MIKKPKKKLTKNKKPKEKVPAKEKLMVNTFYVKRVKEGDSKGQFFWVVTHANGNILSMSSEFYHNRSECLQSAKATLDILMDALRKTAVLK